MANTKAKTVASVAPGVTVTAEICQGRFVIIEYAGYPSDLVAKGAIEAHMAEVGPTRGGRTRFDSVGDRFIRKPFRSGKLKVTRYVTRLERALLLPGVPQTLRDDRLDYLDRNPSRLHVDRQVTTCGTGAWVTVAGRSALLVSEGFARLSDDGSLVPLAMHYGRTLKLMNGCIQITYFEYIVRGESNGKAKAPQLSSTRLRPSYLRLVVDNTRAEVTHG
jgi:hypothetical protein